MQSNRFTQAFGALTLLAACGAATTGTTAMAGLSEYHNSRYFDEFNPPPEDYNTKEKEWGHDSGGDKNPNAMQLDRSTMKTTKETYIFDNQGNRLREGGEDVKLKKGKIGYYDGEYFGKILAGGTARMKVGNKTLDMIFVNGAPRKGGGTFSGWVPRDNLSPSNSIYNTNQNIKERRDSSSVRYTEAPDGNRAYKRQTVKNQAPPSSLSGGYIIKNRHSNAGKVEYYYVRDGTLNGFTNLPETGNKRFGVQGSRTKPGESFWRDKGVDYYEQTIYKRDSSRVAGTFRFTYGYFKTSDGERIYCWTNRECME